jgi:hypothetical protein
MHETLTLPDGNHVRLPSPALVFQCSRYIYTRRRRIGGKDVMWQMINWEFQDMSLHIHRYHTIPYHAMRLMPYHPCSA